MGTWGWGLFDNDDAADLRQDFPHYVADCQDITLATDAIAKDFGASVSCPLEHPAFWLALALVQFQKGWLDPRVRSAAFANIDHEERPPAERARLSALRMLRKLLESTPRASSPLPRPWPVQLGDFRVGEIIGRRLPSGRLAIGKVIGFKRTIKLKVRGPAIRLQKWTESRMPDDAQARALECLLHPIGPNLIQTIGSPVLTAPRSDPLDEQLFLRPGIIVPLREREDRVKYFSVSTWGRFSLDDILEAGVERWWLDPDLPASALPPWMNRPGAVAGA